MIIKIFAEHSHWLTTAFKINSKCQKNPKKQVIPDYFLDRFLMLNDRNQINQSC